MKLVKIVLGMVATTVVVVGVVVFLGLQNLDQIVKVAVERVGPQIVGTDVKLAEVKLSLTEGRGELYGLTIANPKGFSDAMAFSLGVIALEIDPASLTGDVVVINEVLISQVQLLAEQKALSQINLQALMDNVSQSSSSSGAKKSAGQSAAAEGEAPIYLAIKKLTLTDINLRIVTEQWGERALKLPAIKLKDIGSLEKGLTPDELGEAILKPILAKAKRAVSNELAQVAKDKAEEKLKEKLSENLDDDQKQQLNQLKSLFGR